MCKTPNSKTQNHLHRSNLNPDGHTNLYEYQQIKETVSERDEYIKGEEREVDRDPPMPSGFSALAMKKKKKKKLDDETMEEGP